MLSRAFWLPPTLLTAVLVLAFLLAPGAAPEASAPKLFAALVYERDALAAGQWWRLWTGHLTHWNAAHLALNLAAVAVWLLLCGRRWTGTRWLLSLLWLGGFSSLGLYLCYPETVRYAGFSGVMHGLFLLGLMPLVLRGDRIALLALGYLVAKVVVEQWLGTLVSSGVDIGARVATEAHLLGSLAAAAQLMGEGVWRRLRPADA